MRLLALIALVTTAHADPAKVTITEHEKPAKVRIGGGGWKTIEPGKSLGPIAITAPATGKAVPIDYQFGRVKQFRRYAVVMPDLAYKLVGNACAFWGLDIDDEVERVGATKVEIDASALPAKAFPIIVSTDATDDNDELGGTTLDKPGVAPAIELMASAMCPRSGSPLVVYSKGTKKRLLDIQLIGHTGAMHVVKLARGGAFTVVVDPAR